MSATPVCVIVGASHAGVQAAISLRRQGWQGGIVMLGEEPYLPYHRPPLSKDYLLGKKGAEQILLRPGAFFEQQGIELRLGQRVLRIDRQRREIATREGAAVGYDRLILATGARPRVLDLPGAGLPGVHYLRTRDDVDEIVGSKREARRAVIVGGGYIGMETAASLRQQGLEITVLEGAPRIMGRVTSALVSEYIRQLHERQGVRVQAEVGVRGFEGDGRIESVIVDDDVEVPADFVIVGIGVLPNVELARDAGLRTGDGIIVDAHARTSDADIYAIGDCTWHRSHVYGRWIRLESVQNAVDQAKIAAASVCGEETPYTALPKFWSDQYDVKLQVAGLSEGYREMVVRGDPSRDSSFSVWYFDGERLLAVDALNDPLAHVAATRIIPGGLRVDKQLVGDPGADLKALLADAAREQAGQN